MEVGAGVDEDGVVVVGEADGGAGAAVARSLRGRHGGGADGAVAAERGDAHGGAAAEEGEGGLHSLLGIFSGRCWGRGWAGRAGLAGFGCGGAGEGLGDFEEGHAELEEGGVEQAGFVGGEVALGLFCEDGEHVDALAGAHEVELGLLAGLGSGAELHDCGHVDGLDELVEAHGGWVVLLRGWRRGWRCRGGRRWRIGAVWLVGLLGGGAGGDSSSFRLGAAVERGGSGAAATGSGCGALALGEGSASGRSSPSLVNLRRSVMTKGLVCSGMVLFFQML